MRRRHRRWHTVAAVAGGILLVILLPVLLPIALFLHSRDQKRMHALAEIFACLSCGRILGADSLRLADEAWTAHMAELARSHDGAVIRYRVVRNFDAICAHCGTYHTFVPKDRAFILARLEDIPVKPGERPPRPIRKNAPPTVM